jgi:hypothetical protein
MNETERDLRELFESKAREAGAAPTVVPEVLRRGRRRQVGTVAVGAFTALAVTVAAVVGLQAFTRGDTESVPGGPQGNPSFTATIQNFSVTVPQGWTLIDQVPLAMTMAVSTSSSFSCVGRPVEAGSRQQADPTTTTDCANTDVQTPQTPEPIPLGGLPMLTLSNQDPGLGGVACNAGGTPRAGSATLYIGLDYGANRGPGWESAYPVERGPLTNVLDGDVPTDQMPCGPGGYARFQASGQPFIAWAGFGSGVSDADRQAIVDAFDGMQVSDAELTPPSSDVPGYVLAGGTVAGGDTPWTLEVSPTDTNVDMHYSEAGGESAGGVGDFTVPSVPIESGSAQGIVFGAITFEADRVELRPADGSQPVPGSILRLPESLDAPFNAFVAPSSAAGKIVAVGSHGDLGSASVEPKSPEPTLEDRRVQADLRNAFVAAKTYWADGSTYEGFDPETALSIEPSLAYDTDAQAVPGEVSIPDVGPDHIVLVEATATGTALCIAEQTEGHTTYGALDAQTAAQCVHGEVAWGQDVHPTMTPAPADTPPTATLPSTTVDLEGFAVPTTLTVSNDGSCLDIELAAGSSGSGLCAPIHDPLDPYATIVEIGGVRVLVGYAPSSRTDRVTMVAENGSRTDAPILYTLRAASELQIFAFPVDATEGMVRITDANDAQLTSPLPVQLEP